MPVLFFKHMGKALVAHSSAGSSSGGSGSPKIHVARLTRNVSSSYTYQLGNPIIIAFVGYFAGSNTFPSASGISIIFTRSTASMYQTPFYPSTSNCLFDSITSSSISCQATSANGGIFVVLEIPQ